MTNKESEGLSWQVVFFVLGGIGILYSGGALSYLIFGNPMSLDYRQLAGQRPFVNAIFFTLVAVFPLVIWSYVRDRREGRRAVMPDRIAGLSYKFWSGVVILAAGIGGSLVSYFSVDHGGGTYVVFTGLIAWGLVRLIRGLM